MLGGVPISVWLPTASAILVALIGLLGVWLGKRLERRSPNDFTVKALMEANLMIAQALKNAQQERTTAQLETDDWRRKFWQLEAAKVATALLVPAAVQAATDKAQAEQPAAP